MIASQTATNDCDTNPKCQRETERTPSLTLRVGISIYHEQYASLRIGHQSLYEDRGIAAAGQDELHRHAMSAGIQVVLTGMNSQLSRDEKSSPLPFREKCISRVFHTEFSK